MNDLVKFIEKTESLDNRNKLRLLLLISGVKPSTYIQLKIGKNLEDKHRFEELLKENNLIFESSRPKGYEEIEKIQGNAVKWKIMGMWYGYDIFSTKPYAQRFLEYVQLLKQKKHKQADLLAGKIYGYPDCCIKKYLQHKINKNYYEHYKELHDMDKKFPFISHTPCTLNCKETQKLNTKYKNAIKKISPKFLKEYSKKRKYTVPLIVDVENKLPEFKKQNGHDYVYITKEPIEKKYWLISWLTKAEFKRGTIIEAEATMQYDYSLIKIKKKIGQIQNLHHERHFTKL